MHSKVVGFHTKTSIRTGDTVFKAGIALIPDETDQSYEFQHVYVPIIPETGIPEGLEGDKLQEWLDALPHEWVTNPTFTHFLKIDPDITKTDLELKIQEIFTPDVLTSADAFLFQRSVHDSKFVATGDKAEWEAGRKEFSKFRELMAAKHRLGDGLVLPKDVDKTLIVANANRRFSGSEGELDSKGKELDIKPGTIDIGAEAIDRALPWGVSSTAVEQSNPANGTGAITSVEVWFASNGSNVEVATFDEGASNVLSTRDSETLGSVTAGSKQTFSGLDMDVETGDYLGLYGTAGNIERTNSGGTGIWYKTGDQIPCTSETFTDYSGRIISLYGEGEEAGAETYTKTVSIDALLQATDSEQPDIDALLKATDESQPNLDVLVRKLADSISANLDILLKALSNTNTVTADALLQALGETSTVDLDSLIQQLDSSSIDVDALLQTASSVTADLDVLTKALGVTKTVALDAFVRALELSNTVDLDAKIGAAGSKAIDTDALVRALGISKTVSLSVLLQALGISETVLIDALVGKPGSQAVDIDALIKALDSNTLTLDGLLRALGVDTTVAVDALIRALVTETVTVDALLQKLGLDKTVALDLLLRGSVSETVNLDVLIQTLASQDVDLDALLKAVDTATVTIDAVVQTPGEAVASIDAYLRAVSIIETVDLDALLQASGVTTTVLLDALIYDRFEQTIDVDLLLRGESTVTPLLDAIISGAGSTTVALDAIIAQAYAGQLTFQLEVHNTDGTLVSILENAFEVSYDARVNSPHRLNFSIPVADPKSSDISVTNEIWLRNMKTNTVVRKFRIQVTSEERVT